MNANTRRYVVVQFVVAIGLILWIGEVYADSSARAVLVPCVALWALLLSLGWLNQGKEYARLFELLRLLAVPVLLLIAERTGMTVTNPTWIVAAVYFAGSALWLSRTSNDLLPEERYTHE
jgi:uncharacterized membrane protein YgdD (TMEM256/DUF423 family)